MAAPIIPPQASMDVILDETSFTVGRLPSHPLAAPFGVQFDTFQATWTTANDARIALRIAAGKAEGAVAAADDVLDDFVHTLDRTLLIVCKNDRKAALYLFYFGPKAPSLLVRPMLGDELAIVRNWIPSLQASPVAAVAALAPALVAAVAAADAAVTAKAAADQAVKDFNTVGGKKTLIDAANALRQNVYGQLAALPFQNPTAMLPATFADRFYRHVTHKGVTALTNPKDVEDKITALQTKVTKAQNRLSNLNTEATTRAADKAAEATAAAALAQAKKDEDAAKQKTKAAKVAAKAAKKKAKK